MEILTSLIVLKLEDFRFQINPENRTDAKMIIIDVHGYSRVITEQIHSGLCPCAGQGPFFIYAVAKLPVFVLWVLTGDIKIQLLQIGVGPHD